MKIGWLVWYDNLEMYPKLKNEYVPWAHKCIQIAYLEIIS